MCKWLSSTDICRKCFIRFSGITDAGHVLYGKHISIEAATMCLPAQLSSSSCLQGQEFDMNHLMAQLADLDMQLNRLQRSGLPASLTSTPPPTPASR